MKICRNPRCQETMLRRSVFRLCPSCTYIGKRALFWGTLAGAALFKLLEALS